jgi:hypothetical protein
MELSQHFQNQGKGDDDSQLQTCLITLLTLPFYTDEGRATLVDKPPQKLKQKKKRKKRIEMTSMTTILYDKSLVSAAGESVR